MTPQEGRCTSHSPKSDGKRGKFREKAGERCTKAHPQKSEKENEINTIIHGLDYNPGVGLGHALFDGGRDPLIEKAQLKIVGCDSPLTIYIE